MEEEDRAVLEEEESVGTQGESLADGVGVIEVAESSNKLGPNAEATSAAIVMHCECKCGEREQ